MRRFFILSLSILLLALPATARADGPSHVVAYGETLYSIARKYGVSPQDLADANGITSQSWVYAGQRLVIPGDQVAEVVDTAPSTSPSGVYVVRAGDSLSSLSRKFGISVAAIADANDIPPNGFLYTGWQLKIPGVAAPIANAPAGNPPANANNAPAPQNDSQGNASDPSIANDSRTNLTDRAGTTTYIVQPGDSLFRIAIRYGVTTQAISIANNLATLFVFSGQRLIIPPAANGSTQQTALSNTSGPAVAASGGLNLKLNAIPLYRQKQTLTCEESAAAMALRGALTEAQIVEAMPRSDNPFEGIRGDTNHDLIGGLTHYGTYAQGLQKGLTKLGHPSTAYYGQPYDKFKESILENLRAGRPVLWWTTWHESYQRTQWVDVSNGTQVPLTPYEHTVVITAANDQGVTYNDPYDGTMRFTPWATHQRTSGYFNNMALVIY